MTAYRMASFRNRNVTQTTGIWENPKRFTTAWVWFRLTPSWPIPVRSPAMMSV